MTFLRRVLSSAVTRELPVDDPPLGVEDEPADDSSLTANEIILGVGVFFLMVGIGASCDWPVLKMIALENRTARKAALTGVGCQFLAMPVLSWALTRIFGVDKSVNDGYTALGFILVGCMPGGGPSNVLTMWCHGVLELSVFMTLASTFLAFAFTPFWLWLLTLYGLNMEESALAFDQIGITFASLVLPLSIGVGLACGAKRIKDALYKPISILAILIFVVAVLTLALEYPDALTIVDWRVIVPAALLCPLAGTISYSVTTFVVPFRPAVRRTIVLEVVLQNLPLALAIGERMIETKRDRTAALPFPLLYALFLYAWVGMLIPAFRYQKYYNDKHGRVDRDPTFLITPGNGDEGDDFLQGGEGKDKMDKGLDSDDDSLRVSLHRARTRTETAEDTTHIPDEEVPSESKKP